MAVMDRFKKAWNAFRTSNVDSMNLDYATSADTYYGMVSPSRSRLQIYNERSIVSSIYTRISVDVAGMVLKHVKLDEDERYKEDMGCCTSLMRLVSTTKASLGMV